MTTPAQTAPRSSKAPDYKRDAFLLFNTREPEVGKINDLLLARGVSTWFSPRDLEPGVEWGPYESRALHEARVAVVLLGSRGWGPSHHEFTQQAIREEKKLIPVLLGDPPKESDLEEFNGLFVRLQYLDFRDGRESKIDDLSNAIKKAVGPVQEAPKAQKIRIDAKLLVKRLIDGDDDDRAEIFDELAQIGRNCESSELHKLIAERLPEFEPERQGGEAYVAIRIALISAAILTLGEDEASPEEGLDETLQRYIDPAYEPNPKVRFWILASGVRGGFFGQDDVGEAELDEFKDSDPAILALKDVIVHREDREYQQKTRSVLLGEDGETRRAVLKALRIVPVPALLKDLCAALQTAPDAYTFYALTEPSLAQRAGSELSARYGPGTVALFAVRALEAAGRYLTARVAALLKYVDEKRTAAALRQMASEGASGKDVAARLLQFLETGLERQLIPGYSSDTTSGHADELDIALDVQTLCSVALAREVEPPLSIGLFGDWGTGKSFFMDRMYEEVKRMADLAASDGQGAKFHSRVAQIRFNAWHYIDANLWASLVNHIFEELAKQVKPQEPNKEEVRKILLSKLETAKELKTEVEQEKTNAEQARALAETNLGAIADERVNKQVRLSDLRATDFWQLAQNDTQFKEDLGEVAGELGIPAVMSSLQDLDAALKDAHSTLGRAKAIAMAIVSSGSGAVVIVLIIVLLVAIPGAAWFLTHYLKLQPFLITASAVLADFAAGAAACARVARAPLQRVNAALGKLDAARKRAMEVVEARRKERSAEELSLERQVNELRAKEVSATQQLTVAEAKVQEIEAKIREIDEGRSLAKYLLQRIQAEDYRKHLGLVSTIQRDFENLSTLLQDAAKKVDTEPIQRIILYVDDLDRCPASRVMEVLQAVHLLLAFKLFVVIVGVDPRWLLHSLEETYSAFKASGGRGGEWITTPQNYLEKIFQIPFSLRPMQATGFSKLMRSLLSPAASSRNDAAKPEPMSETPARPAAASPTGPIGSESTPKSNDQPVAVPPTGGQPSDAQPAAVGPVVIQPLPQAGSGDKPSTQAPPPQATLDYEAMRIQAWESAFASELFGFMPSPRAAKRFSNIYRLLKAPLRGETLRSFEGTNIAPGEFRAAMVCSRSSPDFQLRQSRYSRESWKRHQRRPARRNFLRMRRAPASSPPMQFGFRCASSRCWPTDCRKRWPRLLDGHPR